MCSTFIHSSTDVSSHWFHILAVVSSDDMNMECRDHIDNAELISFGYLPRRGIGRSWGSSIICSFPFSRMFVLVCIATTHAYVLFPLHAHQCWLLVLTYFHICSSDGWICNLLWVTYFNNIFNALTREIFLGLCVFNVHIILINKLKSLYKVYLFCLWRSSPQQYMLGKCSITELCPQLSMCNRILYIEYLIP